MDYPEQDLTLNKEIEDKIKFMFKQIQEPLEKICTPKNINCLNYSYVLNKLFGILGMDKHARCFLLHKNKNKLRKQDQIWKNICEYLEWEFYSSI